MFHIKYKNSLQDLWSRLNLNEAVNRNVFDNEIIELFT